MPKKIEIQPIDNGFTVNIDYGNANNNKVFVSSIEELTAAIVEILGVVSSEEQMAEEAINAKRELLMQQLQPQAEQSAEAQPAL